MTTLERSAFVLGPGEGRAIYLGNFAMVVKAYGEATGGAFSLLEAAEPAGFGPPMHIHHGADEAFYVLEGEYHILLEDIGRDTARVITLAMTTPSTNEEPHGRTEHRRAVPGRAPGRPPSGDGRPARDDPRGCP